MNRRKKHQMTKNFDLVRHFLLLVHFSHLTKIFTKQLQVKQKKSNQQVVDVLKVLKETIFNLEASKQPTGHNEQKKYNFLKINFSANFFPPLISFDDVDLFRHRGTNLCSSCSSKSICFHFQVFELSQMMPES